MAEPVTGPKADDPNLDLIAATLAAALYAKIGLPVIESGLSDEDKSTALDGHVTTLFNVHVLVKTKLLMEAAREAARRRRGD